MYSPTYNETTTITLALFLRDCAMSDATSEIIPEQLAVTDHVQPAAKTCTSELCHASAGDVHRTSQQLDITSDDNHDTENRRKVRHTVP